jgi:galactonate dehydratase
MEHMRITAVKTFLVGGSWRNWLVVKIETDAGVHGVGEATLEGKAKTVEAAVTELARYLIGKDPAAIERHFQEMYRRAFYAGGEVLTSAITGVETALWDIKGKTLGVPVYELLGGRTRDRIKLYANGWYRQGMSPAQFVSAARKVVGLGAKGIKFNPWGGRPGIDFHRLENDILNAGVEVVGALREALGPSVDLYIDCNGIFNTVGNAIRAAKAVEPFNISFFEEPVPHENTDAMAYVRRKIDIPVAAGERLFTIFRFRELLARGGADVVQPDMAHCGGMLEARKIAAIADAHYAAFAPHNANGEISYASAVQLAACVPNFLVLEHFPPEPWRFEVCRNPMVVEDGWLRIPDRPGLGVEFDEAAALAHPYEPIDLYNLHRPEMQLKVPKFTDRLR